MVLLIVGVLVFFAVHFVPATGLKGQLISRMGEGGYKGLFSVFAGLGLALLIYGYGQASYVELWSPVGGSRTLLMLVMPVVSILLIAAQVPNNIKYKLRHPMLIGIALWGVAHLLANGDVASLLLFGSFVLFSILNILSVNGRGGYQQPAPVSYFWDVGVVVTGLVIFVLFYIYHGAITGMPLR